MVAGRSTVELHKNASYLGTSGPGLVKAGRCRVLACRAESNQALRNSFRASELADAGLRNRKSRFVFRGHGETVCSMTSLSMPLCARAGSADLVVAARPAPSQGPGHGKEISGPDGGGGLARSKPERVVRENPLKWTLPFEV